jgi:cytochrome c553
MRSSLPAAPEGGNRRGVTRLVHKKARLLAAFAALVSGATLVAVSACSGNGPPAGQSSAMGPERAVTQAQLNDTVQVCSACHGPGGRRTSPDVPVLAGQQQDYISAQLTAFRDKTRIDPPNASIDMAGMAANLDNAMIARLAIYYAAQSPMAGSTQDATEVAAGRSSYEHGVPDKVLPCIVCHGALAQGGGVTPRLAGQAHMYLRTRLAYFAADPRSDALMHLESMSLTTPQRNDVSDYLAAQSVGASGATAQHGPVTQEQVKSMEQVCSACHEFGGNNVSAVFTFPRLAGQQKDYLSAQLKAFRDKTRADPRARTYMWSMAAGLDDTMIERLAVYYSDQSPLPGFAQDPSRVATGQQIYEQGISGKVLPCMACHGAKAQGAGTTPRLAGQHRLSLERQVAYFAANTRADGLMHQESMSLTAPQISGVSAYLAAQTEGAPSAAVQNGPVTQEQVDNTVRVCSACHEFGGSNVSPIFNFPRLAGQQKDYLSAQLKAFRDKTRVDPPHAAIDMAGNAAGLGDAMIERLAAHYAAQSPAPGSAQDPTDVAAGQTIYEHGIADKVLPCMACHGARAQGTGTTPRLAGQRHAYLGSQLAYFAADSRSDELMHQEAMNLTEQQRGEVSVYLAAQSAGPADTAALKGPVTQEQVKGMAQLCSSCHAFDGRSTSPAFTFPRLAGQQKDYLSTQLKAFRDKTRADRRARAYMWSVATSLDDAMIDGLAAYYSTQPPASGSAQDPTDVAAGKTIYEQGIPNKIPPCLACHLPKAQGAGTTPRLAGQRRLSVERQLAYFAANARTNEVMHQESASLTARQISDISAYLAAQ